jgi:hypothetical protein
LFTVTEEVIVVRELRRMLGPKMQEIKGDERKLHIQKLYYLYY